MYKNILIMMTLLSSSMSMALNCQRAMTQYDMNMCAKADYERVDATLNKVYQQALNTVKDDSQAQEMVRRSERAWLKYRDAQAEMYYPPRKNDLLYYGSFHPVCVSKLYEELTRKRIAELKEWLKKPAEGDMCAP